MRKLVLILILFALAPAAWAHEVLLDEDSIDERRGVLANGKQFILQYFETRGPIYSSSWYEIAIVPATREECLVTADAVEIVAGEPLLIIQPQTRQPALVIYYYVSWARYPAAGIKDSTGFGHYTLQRESVDVRVSWKATGIGAEGFPDTSCTGSGESVFKIQVAALVQITAPTAPISNARVFAYAEANFPSIFTGTATVGQYQQYSYRYYPATGNYLAVDTTGVISLLGPYTGNVLTAVGPVESFRAFITSWEVKEAAAGRSTPP